MSKFNENSLEACIIEFIKDVGYEHIHGTDVHKTKPDVILYETLKAFFLNRYASYNLTDLEMERLIRLVESGRGGSLYARNKEFCKKLSGGFKFQRDDATKPTMFIELIDFESLENNSFQIINQLEIRGAEMTRFPDAILYINGLPLVVLEFKSAVQEKATIKNAYDQLTIRYRRDIPHLFYYNVFTVISDGVNTKYGSLFSEYEHFYSWRKVHKEDKQVDGVNSLHTMVQGLLTPARLLEVIRDFVYFPDLTNKEEKIVCRYPQYFGAKALSENILSHAKPTGDGMGGTYFGATGCGKSHTMLFLVRLLRKHPILNSPTIVLIADRVSLDDQLAERFVEAKEFLNEEAILAVRSRTQLKDELSKRRNGGVFITTIQKFTEDIGLLNDRTNIICISDEAHRTQLNLREQVRVTEQGVRRHYGFAKYLRNSFPNATYVGFTGTPIDETYTVFGPPVDIYNMLDAESDELTVRIIYEGRAARVTTDASVVQEIEDYYARCDAEGANAYQIEASKAETTRLEHILGDEHRLRHVAEDFIAHYELRIQEEATVCGKAMFVCASREIAFRLYKIILELRPAWGNKCLTGREELLTEEEKRELKEIEKIRMVMTRHRDDTPELWNLLGTDDYRDVLAKQFKLVQSNFKIALVVDMWNTGFDVPCLDTMYIDKSISKHTLIQTISRVNRVFPSKGQGLIVDYIGIKREIDLALKTYTNNDLPTLIDLSDALRILKDELSLLAVMFYDFDSTAFKAGTPLEQLSCLHEATEFVQATEERMYYFMEHAKRMKSAYNLCATSDEITAEMRDFVHFYTGIRAMLYKLTKGDAPDEAIMNKFVLKKLEDAVLSDRISVLLQYGEHAEVDLFSEEHLAAIAQIELPNIKIRLLTDLLCEAIRTYGEANKLRSLHFTEKLNIIIAKYNSRHEDVKLAKEVLGAVTDELHKLLQELRDDRDSFKSLGIGYEDKAFYDILKKVASVHKFTYPEEKFIPLAQAIKEIVADKTRYCDWAKKEQIKAQLQFDIMRKLMEHGYPPVFSEEVYKAVLEQATNYKKNGK